MKNLNSLALKQLHDESQPVASATGVPVDLIARGLLAAPRFYAVLAPIYPWHWLWPIRTLRIIRRRKRLGSIENLLLADTDTTVQEIERDLAFIEFAGKPLPLITRTRIRRTALESGLRNWNVRAAFRSVAIQRRNGQWVRSSPRLRSTRAFKISFDLAVGCIVGMLLLAAASFVDARCLQCSSVVWIFLANILLVPAMFFHAFGSDRENADAVFDMLNIQHGQVIN